jgi:hypothetical protein
MGEASIVFIIHLCHIPDFDSPMVDVWQGEFIGDAFFELSQLIGPFI